MNHDSPRNLNSRLHHLSKNLEKHLDKNSENDKKEGTPLNNLQKTHKNMALGMRVFLDMVSALAVGGGIGWFLDGFLATRPFLFILFLLFGFLAGLLNVQRFTRNVAGDS